MQYALTSTHKLSTLGWLIIASLSVLFISLGLGSTAAAHVAGQHSTQGQTQALPASLEQHHHRAPNHCSTPLKSACCACIGTESVSLKQGVSQPLYPPVPLRQDYSSRLIGPAQPPPRAS